MFVVDIAVMNKDSLQLTALAVDWQQKELVMVPAIDYTLVRTPLYKKNV